MSDVLPEAGKVTPPAGSTPAAGEPNGAAPAPPVIAGADGATPVRAAPIGEMTIGEEPAGRTLVGEAPAGDTPGGDSTSGEPPVGDAPAGDTPEGPAQPPAGAHRRRRRFLVSWLTVIVLGAAVALGLRLFVVQTFFVPSGSMLPTLQVGDRMLVLKIGYTIQRGAIVVFHRPPGDLSDPNQDDLVKRVIGLPGETIWSVGNTVYINGAPLAEPWLPKNDPLGPPIARQKIPKGDYFMMGDNRTNSYDSRDWGPLPRSYIIGRVFLVIWRHGRPAFHII